MFKRKLKIVQISTAAVANAWYIVGLGNDGRAYAWDKWRKDWVICEIENQAAPVASEGVE